MEAWETILLVIIFLVIIVAVVWYVWFYEPTQPLDDIIVPGAPPSGSITNCSTYEAKVISIGEPGGPECKPGTVLWDGLCYKDLWTQAGGVKTGYDRVYYGPYGGVKTKCGIGIYYLQYGAPCPMIGPDYYKTAVCTCQYKGSISASLYNQSEGLPDTCPVGSDAFKHKCFIAPCPSGYKRTAECVCSPVS